MTEIELKLALPMHGGSSLARRVAVLPALAGLPGRREVLHNVYYDTPDHALSGQGAVLRVREVRRGGKTLWLQTLKTSDLPASAMSRRGEWEATLPGPALSAALLHDTPWGVIDPHGRLFAQLKACFSTRFTRRCWLCHRPDGSVIELALDTGTIVSGDRSLPIQELELELKAGPADALLALARELAADLPCIPATQSKSERGYALAGRAAVSDCAPTDSAQEPPGLWVVAQAALHDAFAQFSSRLIDLCLDDDPEHTHQARVGWRRFRSARRLFKPVWSDPPALTLEGLRPLLDALTELRELDVAHAESLPAMAPAFIAGDAQRARAWHALMEDLRQDCVRSRARVRRQLAQAGTAQALLAVTAWLEAMASAEKSAVEQPTGESQRAWARQRIRRLGRDLRQACRQLDDVQTQHRARILAKRLRYGVESLRALLPAARARRWHRRAQRWQSTLGAPRDLTQAIDRVARMPGHQAIAEFLRGYQSGMTCRTVATPDS